MAGRLTETPTSQRGNPRARRRSMWRTCSAPAARREAAATEPPSEIIRGGPNCAGGIGPATRGRRPRVRSRRAHHPPARLRLCVHAGERTASAAHAPPGDHGEPGEELRPGAWARSRPREARSPCSRSLSALGPGRGAGHERPGPAQRTGSPALDRPAGAGGQRGHHGEAGHIRRSLRMRSGPCTRERSSPSSTATARITTRCRASPTRRAASTTSYAHRFEPAHPGRRPRRASFPRDVWP